MFPPVKLPKYPHMLPRDVAIWDRFLEKHGGEFVSFNYDVHVGGEVERVDTWTQQVYEMALTLAAKRIDAVGYKPGEIWIFEVKPNAGVTAVGQLVMYRDLFIRDMRPDVAVFCALVCETIVKDEIWQLEKLGFKYYVV